MQTDFEFSINGDTHRGGGMPVDYSLWDYLRDHNVRGRQDPACGDGSGICSVLMVEGDGRQRDVLRLANACRMKLPVLAGREIWTIDAISGEEVVNALQEGLDLAEKLSCHCSGGRLPRDSGESHENNVKRNFRNFLTGEGNFFRATGCLPLSPALRALLQEQKGTEGAKRGQNIAVSGERKSLPAFAYRDPSGNLFFRPAKLKAALRLLQSHPGASVVAGDTLYPDQAAVALPLTGSRQVLVSLESVIQLRQVSLEEAQWQIGCMVTIRAMVDALHGKFPVIDSMAARFGSLQVRNRSTVGGNLAWSAPDSELTTVLLALDAQVVMSSLSGERVLNLKDCLGGVLRAAPGRGEILRSLLLKCPWSTQVDQEGCHHLSGFYKITRRNYNSRAIVCAAFVVEINDTGRVSKARLCYGGVAENAMRAHEAEEILMGELWGPKVERRVANSLREAFPARSDCVAGADYRKAMAGELWRKFFAENSTPGQAAPIANEAGHGTPSLETFPGSY
jgi:xanthine dehydrogenase iron-sulfur cluster and FAD-binding subunit A